MTTATEAELGTLHRRVAETMIKALDQSEVASGLLIKYPDDLPSDVVDFLESFVDVNPSLLTAATKFLKDNHISCDPEEDSALSELENKLQAKKGNVTSIGFE